MEIKDATITDLLSELKNRNRLVFDLLLNPTKQLELLAKMDRVNAMFILAAFECALEDNIK